MSDAWNSIPIIPLLVKLFFWVETIPVFHAQINLFPWSTLHVCNGLLRLFVLAVLSIFLGGIHPFSLAKPLK